MFLDLCGAKLHFEQYGEGKPDVLLLHGWGCSIETWKAVTNRFARRSRVTVIDFPAHGQSERPPEPWGAHEFSEQVAALIRALHIEGCDVVGHSHGGRIALTLAIEHPELVGKLVLTGAAGLKGKPTEAQKKRSEEYKRLRGIADALDKIRLLGPLPEKMREALRKKYGSPDYNALDAEMRKTFVKLVSTDLTGRLGEVKAPTLLLWGTNDTETPLWMGRIMEKSIPDCALVELKGGSHFAFLEQLGFFCQVLEQYFYGGTTA